MRTWKIVFILVCMAVWLLYKILDILVKRRAGGPTQKPGRLVQPETTAKRALCLAGVAIRGDMEALVRTTTAILDTDVSKAAEIYDPNRKNTEVLSQWLRDEGLWNALSAKERKFMSLPLMRCSEQDVADAEWRREAAGTLAWAVGLVPALPPWDTRFDDDLPQKIGWRLPLAQTLQRLSPQSEAKIRRTRDIAELWLWRARTTQLMRDQPGTPLPDGLTFAKIITMSAEKARQEGIFEPIDNDFPAFWKAYRDLSEDEWSTMRSIAHERLYALNWLCGYSADWDNVRCST